MAGTLEIPVTPHFLGHLMGLGNTLAIEALIQPISSTAIGAP